MSIRRPLLTLFAVVVGVPVLLSGAPSQMGIEEIRPGMVGIGRTVFDGTHVEEFKAHIIGVLENVIGTRRNLILAKLEGGPLAFLRFARANHMISRGYLLLAARWLRPSAALAAWA